MPKITLEQLDQKIDQRIDDLARSIAENFATKEELRAIEDRLGTKMQNGFALVMEELKPMRRDYQALKDDLAPQIADHSTRISTLEQKIA